MSLQIWLPLNGDLHNQGLSNFNIVTNNVTFINTGKIGQCASFNGSNSYIYINNVTLGNNWSYGCWVNTPASDSRGWEIAIILNNTGSDADSQLAFWIHQKENRFETLANTQYNSTVSYAAYYGTWHHFFATFNGNVLTTYMDGIIVNTKTITAAQYTGTNLTIGARCTGVNGSSFGNYFQGQLNDVRIYDHALSDKEVEEIAKGLILHYKLDNNGMGGNNLATNTAFPTSAIQGYNGQNAIEYNHSDWTSGGRFFAGYSSSQLTFTEIQANQPYTISAWVYIYNDVTLSNPGGTSIFYRIYKTGDSPTYSYDIAVTLNGIAQRNQWVKVSSTFISPVTYTYNQGGTFSIGGYNGHFLVSMPQVELGSTATPWSPNPTDSGIDSSIVYDSSGYNNYGELYNYDANGSIITISDSPKYDISTFINSASNTTNTASGTRYIYGHCALTNPTTMSVAFWCKPIAGYGNSTGQGQFCTTTYEFGNANAGSDYQASAMNHRDSAVDINDSASTTQCRPTFLPTANEWHHYTITYDGQTGKVYKDGVQSSTASFSAAKTLDSFIGVIIGFSKAGGVWRSNQSYFSDFRIYATALTAEQVAELYHTSATIDNKGNIYARELVEE